jgi:tetratricopeptide (TPR) repeat protein
MNTSSGSFRRAAFRSRFLLSGSLLFLALSAATPPAAQGATSGCPDLGKPFGDYLVDKDKVALSERFHFTPEVESLVRGKSSEKIGADLDFMLSNYPNHHRALVAMMRLAERMKSPQPPGARASVECYFVLALNFRRDDPVARMLYATFLAKNGRQPDAAAQLETVKRAVPDDPLAQYNIGLIYLDMKNYDKALEQAHRAQELGVTRTDLRDRLRSAGRWKEPDPAAPASSAPQNSASAAN